MNMYTLHNKQNIYTNKTNNRNIIIRILGNDLDKLHGCKQVYNNTEFILKNEHQFGNNVDKLYILNRIIDINKKNSLINLLKKYNSKYIDIPFNITKFNEINEHNISEYEINNTTKQNIKQVLLKLYYYNLYLINNNGARNYALEYGKKKGYKWIFVLDGNSYLTEEQYIKIFNNVTQHTKYIVVPQLRISELNLNNEDILNKNPSLNKLTVFEPQILFHRDSKCIFNNYIPYGSSPKAELLRVLNVNGKWSKWNDNYTYYNIKDRAKTTESSAVCSSIYRLNSFNKNNNTTLNYVNRHVGLWYLIEKCRNIYQHI